MPETALVWLSARRFFRNLIGLGQTSWLLLVGYLFLAFIFAAVFFRLGQADFSQSWLLFGSSLVITFLAGLWTGYVTLDGQRPSQWRLVPKTAWFYLRISQTIAWLLVAQLITIGSFYLGSNWAAELVWWSVALILLSNLALAVGLLLLGTALAVGIKVISRNYLIRSILLVLLVYLGVFAAHAVAPVFRSIDFGWQTLESNSLLTILLFCLGLAGLGLALAEIILPRYHIQTTTHPRYWQLKLPNIGMGHFGAGTALFVGELLYFLRSSRLQRRLITTVVAGLVGLITLNLFTNFYSANAQTLFYGLVAVLVAFMAQSIGFTTGQKAESNQERYRPFPISRRKLRLSYLFSSLTATLIVTTLIVELFIAGVMPLAEMALVFEIGLLINWASFEFGRASQRVERQTGDPLINQALTSFVYLLIMIIGAILMIFNGQILPAVTALVLLLWAVAWRLIASRSGWPTAA